MSLTNKVSKTSRIDALIKVDNSEMLKNDVQDVPNDKAEKLKLIRVKAPKQKKPIKNSEKLTKRRH